MGGGGGGRGRGTRAAQRCHRTGHANRRKKGHSNGECVLVTALRHCVTALRPATRRCPTAIAPRLLRVPLSIPPRAMGRAWRGGKQGGCDAAWNGAARNGMAGASRRDATAAGRRGDRPLPHCSRHCPLPHSPVLWSLLCRCARVVPSLCCTCVCVRRCGSGMSGGGNGSGSRGSGSAAAKGKKKQKKKKKRPLKPQQQRAATNQSAPRCQPNKHTPFSSQHNDTNDQR